MERVFTALLLSCVFGIVLSQFNIPLPFGSLNFNKREDGKVEVGVDQGANFFGYGGKRNFKVVAGNGTFETENENAVLVNGTEYGGGGKIGVDKETGVDLGSKAIVGEKKIENDNMFCPIRELTFDRRIQTSATRPGDFFGQLLGAIHSLRPSTTEKPKKN